MQVLRTGKKPPRREELYAMLVDDTTTARFVTITGEVGKPFQYRKAAALCGMRVSPDVVSFALTRLTKLAVKRLVDQPTELPRPVLARVERHAPKTQPQPGEVVLQALLPDNGDPVDDADELAALFDEADGGRRAGLINRTWRLKLDIDGAGIVDIEADEPGVIVDMPRGALKATLFLHSPVAGRIVGVSYTGHLAGAPGSAETPERIAAQILHLMTRMPEFRMLANINDVRIPAKTNLSPARTWTPPQLGDVTVTMPVALYTSTSDTAPLATGRLGVRMDLESAPERLLYHLEPDDTLSEHLPTYADTIVRYITGQVETRLGPSNVQQARIDITLGELSEGMRDELQEAIDVLALGACFTTEAASPMPSALAETL